MVKEPPTRTPPSRVRRGQADAEGVPAQFARLEEQFAQLKARVRQAQQLAGLASIAPILAHEVNNLLTPIIGYAGSAVDSDDVELMRKALAVTQRNARIVVNMADRLLRLSAAKPAERSSVNMRKVVDDAYAGLCRDLSRDGISFKVEVPEHLCVLGDELQITQLLFNLFLNAYEAMKGSHNGSMSVRAYVDPRDEANASPVDANKASQHRDDERPDVTIELCNTGPAIPKELLPHIFDAFESSKPLTTGNTKCSGLGLALCRDLVEENGGCISVQSDAENGTKFTIRLPAADPQTERLM